MKKKSNGKIIREAKRYLKRMDLFQAMRRDGYNDDENYQISYILKKKNDLVICAISTVWDENTILCIRPSKDEVRFIDDELFDFDQELFKQLEEGYEIVTMDLFTHCCVWKQIGEEREEIRSVDGMHKYIAYCKRNGITMELLAEEVFFDKDRVDITAIRLS